ncbi:DUF4347 domain-containing protein, partial [Thermodesulfobacteriota bacterium]
MSKRSILIEPLEERIVFESSLGSAGQDTAGDADDPERTAASDGSAVGNSNCGSAPQGGDSWDNAVAPGGDLKVVLISNALDGIEVISQASVDDAHVIRYDDAEDNLSTISTMLEAVVDSSGQEIGAPAFLSHGSEGLIRIGASVITLANVGDYFRQFEALGSIMADDGQVQIYCCDVAGSLPGKALAEMIAMYTRADVFLSEDTTGGASEDWELEYASDPSESPMLLFNDEELALARSTLYVTGPLFDLDMHRLPGKFGPDFPDVLYLSGSNDAYGCELFTYDPKTGTLELVADINPGTADSNPANFV